MEGIIGKLSNAEVNHLQNLLIIYNRRFLKLITIVLLFEFFTLLTPLTILAPIRGTQRSDFDSEFLFSEFGGWNVFFFILFPTLLIFACLYFKTFNINGLKKDLKYKEKISGIYEVLEIRSIPKSSSESFEGIYDYKTVFKINDLDLEDITFSSKTNPECLEAKAYKVEVARFSKTNLKREIVK